MISLAALPLASCSGDLSTLDPAGPYAGAIANLWWIMLFGAGLILSLVLVLFCLVFFKPGFGRSLSPKGWMIAGGLFLPVPVLIALMTYGMAQGEYLIGAWQNEPVMARVEAHGSMWQWEFRYPDYPDAEPTIGVMNRVKLDFAAVGNHEFDRGWRELKRLREGGCEKLTLREPCAVEPDFKGSDFPILAANVRMPDGTTLFPGHGIKRFGSGAREVAVGVIGMTLQGTANIVEPAVIAGLTFEDEATAINALVPRLVEEGADAIVVSIHQGLVPEPGTGPNACGAMAGDLRTILEKLDPRIDLVISGHTHRAYVCDFSAVDPSRRFKVTSAGFGGTMLTDIALTIDPRQPLIRQAADAARSRL